MKKWSIWFSLFCMQHKLSDRPTSNLNSHSYLLICMPTSDFICGCTVRTETMKEKCLSTYWSILEWVVGSSMVNIMAQTRHKQWEQLYITENKTQGVIILIHQYYDFQKWDQVVFHETKLHHPRFKGTTYKEAGALLQTEGYWMYRAENLPVCNTECL